MSIFNINIDDVKSHGSYVFDESSNAEYLDLHSQFSSLPLGYNHPALGKEFEEELIRVGKMKTSFCAFNRIQKDEFEEMFLKFVPASYSFIHYACTGALAVEAAIKASWHHHNYKRKKIVSLVNSFHGVNSYGSLLSTSPRLTGVPSCDWAVKLDINGDWQTYIEREKDSIAAIIVEPVQCTFGDYYLPEETLLRIRELCTWYGIVMIFDEIQTGLSVNSIWAFQCFDFRPDIVVFGKKFQVSGIMIKPGYDKIEKDIMRLSVTFDGDACDMVRSKYVLQEIWNHKLWRMSGRITPIVECLQNAKPLVCNVRYKGALIAFDFATGKQRDQFAQKAFENKLLVNSTGVNTVRLRPNLAITRDEVNHAAHIMKNIFETWK